MEPILRPRLNNFNQHVKRKPGELKNCLLSTIVYDESENSLQKSRNYSYEAVQLKYDQRLEKHGQGPLGGRNYVRKYKSSENTTKSTKQTCQTCQRQIISLKMCGGMNTSQIKHDEKELKKTEAIIRSLIQKGKNQSERLTIESTTPEDTIEKVDFNESEIIVKHDNHDEEEEEENTKELKVIRETLPQIDTKIDNKEEGLEAEIQEIEKYQLNLNCKLIFPEKEIPKDNPQKQQEIQMNNKIQNSFSDKKHIYQIHVLQSCIQSWIKKKETWTIGNDKYELFLLKMHGAINNIERKQKLRKDIIKLNKTIEYKKKKYQDFTAEKQKICELELMLQNLQISTQEIQQTLANKNDNNSEDKNNKSEEDNKPEQNDAYLRRIIDKIIEFLRNTGQVITEAVQPQKQMDKYISEMDNISLRTQYLARFITDVTLYLAYGVSQGLSAQRLETTATMAEQIAIIGGIQIVTRVLMYYTREYCETDITTGIQLLQLVTFLTVFYNGSKFSTGEQELGLARTWIVTFSTSEINLMNNSTADQKLKDFVLNNQTITSEQIQQQLDSKDDQTRIANMQNNIGCIKLMESDCLEKFRSEQSIKNKQWIIQSIMTIIILIYMFLSFKQIKRKKSDKNTNEDIENKI